MAFLVSLTSSALKCFHLSVSYEDISGKALRIHEISEVFFIQQSSEFKDLVTICIPRAPIRRIVFMGCHLVLNIFKINLWNSFILESWHDFDWISTSEQRYKRSRRWFYLIFQANILETLVETWYKWRL